MASIKSLLIRVRGATSVTSKKSPNVYKVAQEKEKLKILTSLPKLPMNEGKLGKLMVSSLSTFMCLMNCG